MEISVIIPTYKPQSYLWECLDSLVDQTFDKGLFEVILVLNGCTEPWKSQIEAYISCRMQGMNVNFIHTEQGGVSNARNLALDVVQGEYVTFIDDDDYISPSYFEELYGKASHDVVSLSYAYAFNDGHPEVQRKYSITETYNYCITNGVDKLSSKARKYFSGPWMKLIPMNFIQNRRYDVRFKNGEDSLFMFSISDKIDKVAFTSKKAIYYRRYREGSAVFVSRTKKQRILNCIRLIGEYSKIYKVKRHSLYFYLSRVAAELISIFNVVLSKI